MFAFLGQHFHAIELEPKGLVRNVKLALIARFTNHLFSALLLGERGLLLDAFNCSRAALETTAFYWLVCKDNNAAQMYDAEKSVPPVEVRKRLEAIGIDVAAIRERYSLESTVAHVGNKYDQLQIRWERGGDGRLLIGGGIVPEVQKALFEGIVRATFRFIRFDDRYDVPDLDDPKNWTKDGIAVSYPKPVQ